MSPQSIASKSSPDSISIMLRPISPRPPRGISRTTGSTKLLSESGLIVPSTSKFAVVSRSVEAGRREESTPRNIEAPRPALRVNAQDSDARLTEMECWRACVSRRAGLSHADHGKRTGRRVAALMNDQREPTESIWGGGLEARDELRSEEHTSELQSLTNLVCRLLLECSGDPRDLHSFPTRRSSDLAGFRRKAHGDGVLESVCLKAGRPLPRRPWKTNGPQGGGPHE